MFESVVSIKHGMKSKNYLFDHYTSDEIERRVEMIYEVDYDNAFLDLEKVPIGHAQSFYQKRYIRRFGSFKQ